MPDRSRAYSRPHRLYGTTHRVRTPLGTAFVTINRDENGHPFEVFANVGKAGSDIAAVSEALGRLISLVLQIPSSMSPVERLEAVCEQLDDIGGSRHLGFGTERVSSLPDGLATALRREVERHSDRNTRREGADGGT